VFAFADSIEAAKMESSNRAFVNKIWIFGSHERRGVFWLPEQLSSRDPRVVSWL